MTEKICVQCSKKFEPRVGNQKCCSPECFSAYRKEYGKKNCESRIVERKCRQCDGIYRRVYEKSGFCSISCGSKWNLEHGAFETWRNSSANRPKTGSMVACTHCNKFNYREPNQFEAGYLPFCNKTCKGNFFSKAYTGSGNPMFGQRLTIEQKTKQRASLFANHGVTNAWTLAKHRTTSKAHQEIYETLNDFFPQQLFETEQLFRSGSHEYYLDIVSEPLKLIVEYNGDYWHCNPKRYEPTFFHQVKKMTAEEIWSRDEKRINALKCAGYNVLVVWENDYHQDSAGTVEMLKKEVKKRCVSG